MVELERKSPEEIKEKILRALNSKPINAQDIGKAINSNWSTVKSYLTELISDGKVREVSFGEKNVIYLKVTGDTYFNLPIKEEDKKILKFIFSNAIKQYKESKGKQIRRTELAKITDYVNSKLNLNLPIVWYIHGPMPLLVMDLDKDYSFEYLPQKAEEINREITNWIKEKQRAKVREVVEECYTEQNNKLYQIKLKIYETLEEDDLRKNLEELASLSRDFYLIYLGEFRESNLELVERFYGIVSGISLIGKINSVLRAKLILTFDAIWKFIASKTLYSSLLKLGYEKEVAELYMSPVIETKKCLAEEALKELDEEYVEILPKEVIKKKESELGKKLSEVLDEWTESGVWRK